MTRVVVRGGATPQVVAAIAGALGARAHDVPAAPSHASTRWRAAARRETLRATRP